MQFIRVDKKKITINSNNLMTNDLAPWADRAPIKGGESDGLRFCGGGG